jgi:hypothetical protein
MPRGLDPTVCRHRSSQLELNRECDRLIRTAVSNMYIPF